MSLNIFVSQRHVQTIQIKNTERECMQRICIDLSVIPTRCDSAFLTRFQQKRPTCVAGSRPDMKEGRPEQSYCTVRFVK